MRVFLDANVRFTAAKLPIVRAAHACKANVLLTGDHRDFGFLMNAPERGAPG
jgi:hypothetical protein